MCKTASLAALICTKSANLYHKVWTSIRVNGGTDSMVSRCDGRCCFQGSFVGCHCCVVVSKSGWVKMVVAFVLC